MISFGHLGETYSLESVSFIHSFLLQISKNGNFLHELPIRYFHKSTKLCHRRYSYHWKSQPHNSSKVPWRVFITPTGSAKDQLHITILKAKELSGKLNNCSLPLKEKWLATWTIIDPSVTYPLVNPYFTDNEIRPLESMLSSLQCSALGLNFHFPRVILHGSMLLGGLGIPTAKQKATRDRINYFLFNMHHPSTISTKIVASIIFTQLEIGIFTPFFSSEFQRFGPLATPTCCVQIWKETQPHGVPLRLAKCESWLPEPLSQEDMSIMELATRLYNSKEAYMINRCRLSYKLYQSWTFSFIIYQLFTPII